MPTSTRQSGVLSWLVVVTVGVLILLVVFGLTLFTHEVIPDLPERQHDFATLGTITPPISWFPTLLTILGLLVIVYSAAMIVLIRKVEPPRRKELRWSES